MDIGWCLKLNSPALLGNSSLLQKKKKKDLMNHLILSSLDALMGFKISAWLSRALLPETRQSRPSNWYSLFSTRAGTFWSDVFSRLPYEILFEESILILKEKSFQNISCPKWTKYYSILSSIPPSIMYKMNSSFRMKGGLQFKNMTY